MAAKFYKKGHLAQEHTQMLVARDLDMLRHTYLIFCGATNVQLLR